MNSGNGKKSRAQLLAEIAALEAELGQRGSDPGKVAVAGSVAPVFSAPITRRESLMTWVAPVILALPVVQAVGMVLKPGTAHAAATKAPTPPKQTGRCVVAPTAAT